MYALRRRSIDESEIDRVYLLLSQPDPAEVIPVPSEDFYRSKEQAVRYRELLAALKAAIPIIEKLRWYRPPVSLDSVTRLPA